MSEINNMTISRRVEDDFNELLVKHLADIWATDAFTAYEDVYSQFQFIIEDELETR